jgi:hypothetical protein
MLSNLTARPASLLTTARALARLADAGGFLTALKEADRGTACTREEG